MRLTHSVACSPVFVSFRLASHRVSGDKAASRPGAVLLADRAVFLQDALLMRVAPVPAIIAVFAKVLAVLALRCLVPELPALVALGDIYSLGHPTQVIAYAQILFSVPSPSLLPATLPSPPDCYRSNPTQPSSFIRRGNPSWTLGSFELGVVPDSYRLKTPLSHHAHRNRHQALLRCAGGLIIVWCVPESALLLPSFRLTSSSSLHWLRSFSLIPTWRGFRASLSRYCLA